MTAQRRLHVGFLIPTLEVGGLEWMVVHLARCMTGEERASVVCYDDGGELEAVLTEAGVSVHVCKRKPGVDFHYPFRLHRLLRDLGIDVLHAHNDTALFYGGVAAFLARIPVVYTEHDRIFPGRLAVRILNFALAVSTRQVVTVSEELRSLLLRFERIGGDRVRVVPNGVHLPGADPAVAGAVRESWSIPAAARVVGVVAGLKPVKDHQLLLEATSGLLGAFPDLHVVLAGDGPLRADLEMQARKLGMEDRVRILGFRSDLGDIYSALDVVVLPSRSEGLPLTLIEAMAMERPVVASRVGGIPEVVVDGVTGLLFEVGDVHALQDSLKRLLMDPALRREMGRAGRARFLNRFTLDRMAGAYRDIYRSSAGV